MAKSRKGKSLLKQYRERLDGKPSQEDIARLVPMSLGGYQAIEVGDAIPKLDRAIRVCVALKMSIQDFCRIKGIDISGLPSETIDPITEEV